MTETFLHLPEKATTRNLWSLWAWLPAWEQIRAALALHVDQVSGPWEEEQATATNWTMTSMRQGMGLVVLAAWLGGALPFVVHWVQAAQMGTALPLLSLVRYAEQQSATAALSPFTEAWTEAVRTVAGLPPSLPSGLAAALSALGAWANWPLTWLTIWLVYGIGVFVALKVQGATNTLSHFYAATSYAFAPLILLGLRPLPYIGILLGLAGIVWALLIYGQAVRTLTQLSNQRVILSLLAPLVAAVILSLAVLGIIALIFLPLLF